MRKRRIRFRPLLLSGMVFTVLLCLGTTYAGWTENLSITEKLTTGLMNIVFSDSDDRVCQAEIVSADGKESAELSGVTAEVSKSGKKADITVAIPVPLSDLLTAGQEDTYIRIEFPLKKGDMATIDQAEAYEADLEQEPQETVTMITSSIYLKTEGMERGVKLSSKQAGKFGKALTFDVWRGLEDDGGLTGVIYLKLDQKGRNTVSRFPEELKFDQGDLPEELAEEIPDEILEDDGGEDGAGGGENTGDNSGGGVVSFDASVTVNYKCTVPFFIEQGHDEMIALDEA